MSSASAQGLMFQQRLDPLTGNSEWVVIVEEEEEGDGGSWEEESKSPLLAKTSYLDMLNDTRRNRAYYEAIKKTITKPCHVLDIGAGTGLLSMMTARTMEQLESTSSDDLPGVVTACESYLPMVKLMRRVLRLNGMERKIHIINKRSDELKVGVDISSRADVMVSEILDSELLGEGLIPTLQNAHDMLLVENALTVPYRATTYGQVFQIVHKLIGVTTGSNVYGSFQGRVYLYPRKKKSVYTPVTMKLPSLIISLKHAQGKLQGKDSYLCVVADDSVFLTILIASLSKESHVISLFPGLQDGGKYLQAVADANGFSIDRVKVAKKRSRLTMQDTEQRKVDLLIGEPFYYGNDGMLPWQNLRFWKERTKLDSMLSGEVKIMPCKGVLKACAMSLPDLWKSRRCLGKVEGFDHSAINSILGASGAIPSPQESPFLPFYIWQCGNIEELSVPVEIMEFDFAKPISSCCGQAKIELIKPGICHGLVFWIDWVLDEEKSIIISTGPDQRYWKQGVKLLAMPKTVETNGATTTSNTSCTINASFDPSDGELVVQHAFAP
ncbi:unnamed protein product [Rhodiola kirilowii]